MTTPDILYKLAKELDAGVESEVQVVYLLAGIRKLIERDDAREKYPDLNFHCDWALHAKLDRRAAKEVLLEFDAAHAHLRGGTIELHDLPKELGSEIDRISKMTSFEEELSQFFEDYGLPTLTKNRSDGWPHFLHLYARVIEDIPLVVTDATARHISHVTVHLQLAPQPVGEYRLFQVTWRLHDRNGQSGDIFVIHSFDEAHLP
jgi:hypothetical protein